MNRSRQRRKRLGLPPYGTNVMGVDVPNKMQRRTEGLRRDGSKDDGCHFKHGIRRRLVRFGDRPHAWPFSEDKLPFGEF